MTPKRIFFSLIILAFLIAGLAVVIFGVRQRQDIRKRATGTTNNAVLTMSSVSNSVSAGGSFDVKILLDPQSNSVSAAQVVIKYPVDKLTLEGVTPGPFFLASHNSATTEMLNKTDITMPGAGKAVIGAPCTIATPWVCYPQNSSAVSTLTFATFRFRAKTGVSGQAAITFDNTNILIAAVGRTGNLVNTGQLNDLTITILSCSPGETFCSGVCKNLQTDPANCGVCGNACGATQTCTKGGCVTSPECTIDTQCADDKKCNAGKCEQVICTTSPECKTNVIVNHVCNLQNVVDGTACTSVTGGVCAGGVCTALPPVKAALNFRVKLPGTVRVILKQNGVEKTRFDNVPLTAENNGIYSGAVSGIDTGTYDVLVKGIGFLQKKFSGITLNSGKNSQNWTTTLFKAGDVTGDNVIDVADVSALLSQYTTLSVPVTSANRQYDLDNNGTINIVDVSLMLSNYTSLSISGDN